MTVRRVLVWLAHRVFAIPLLVVAMLLEWIATALFRQMRRGNRYEPTRCCTPHLAALEHTEPDTGVPEMRDPASRCCSGHCSVRVATQLYRRTRASNDQLTRLASGQAILPRPK